MVGEAVEEAVSGTKHDRNLADEHLVVWRMDLVMSTYSGAAYM
jgi:hypothetical protein